MCFSDEQLDGYVENNTDEKLRDKIEEHLKTCEDCFENIKEKTKFKNLLTQDLGTLEGNHPEFDEIESFYHKKLEKDKEEEILNHLAYCDTCREMLEMIKIEQKLVNEGKIAPVKIPKKLSPELEAYFMKKRIKEIISSVIQKRFPDKREYFTRLWEKISDMPEITFPKTAELAGALGIVEMETDTPESHILKLIFALEDAEKKIDEKDPIDKKIKKIRKSAKKNKVKQELIDDLVELAKTSF